MWISDARTVDLEIGRGGVGLGMRRVGVWGRQEVELATQSHSIPVELTRRSPQSTTVDNLEFVSSFEHETLLDWLQSPTAQTTVIFVLRQG